MLCSQVQSLAIESSAVIDARGPTSFFAEIRRRNGRCRPRSRGSARERISDETREMSGKVQLRHARGPVGGPEQYDVDAWRTQLDP
jgi:hypothetical protein